MFNPQLVERPALFPQRCITCLGADRPVVDTGVALPEDLGRLYICLSCMRDIAAAAGYADREEWAALMGRNVALEAQLSVFDTVMEGLKNDIGDAHARAVAGLDAGSASARSVAVAPARRKREPRVPAFTAGDFDSPQVDE